MEFKFKKKLILLFFVVCISIVSMFATSYYLIGTKMTSKVEDPINHKAMIILGAGLWGSEVSPQLKRRLDSSLKLIEQNPELLVVVSGGQGDDEDISEAKAMKDYLVDNGADESKVIMEDKSTSTFENISFSKKLLTKWGLENSKIIIVSTDFHMYRAEMIANRMDMDVSMHASPNLEILKEKNRMRETLALIKDGIFNF